MWGSNARPKPFLSGGGGGGPPGNPDFCLQWGIRVFLHFLLRGCGTQGAGGGAEVPGNLSSETPRRNTMGPSYTSVGVPPPTIPQAHPFLSRTLGSHEHRSPMRGGGKLSVCVAPWKRLAS